MAWTYSRFDIGLISPLPAEDVHRTPSVAIIDTFRIKVNRLLRGELTHNKPYRTKSHSESLTHNPPYRTRDPRQKRNNQDHEVTHFICPTHSDINIFECDENDTSHPGYKRQEQEAFQGSSAFQMPIDLYVGDILSLPTQIKAIEALHDRYETALEVAAIWYAYVNPRLCAVVMVEPNAEAPDEAGAPSEHLNGQLRFWQDMPLQPRKRSGRRYTTRSGRLVEVAPPREQYPLRVKYASHSSRLRRLKFIRSGIGIDEDSLIFKAWNERRRLAGEIPAAVFGSSEKWGYHAECLPLGKSGKILTLVWLTDQQPFKLFT